MLNENDIKIAIVGQGYVGLPLAIEFGKIFPTVGFDINSNRIKELKNGIDITKEAQKNDIKNSKLLEFSSSIDDIRNFNHFIVTVPTPVDKFNQPDLKYLNSACTMLGQILKKNDLVIFESTVFPGCTEEFCVPILESYSGLIFNKDFFCGYSPERIVPGDKLNTLTSIIKVTSGSNEDIASKVDDLYKKVIKAGTHKASNIKVAEASKAIENAQRDLNISFVNELALMFDRMGIDTNEVIEAAATKWNFLKFTPGLVGGHCISVDPYYLTHKAESLGYYPQVILSGRRVNNLMSSFISSKLVKMIINSGKAIKGSKVLILGITFKENCPDIRNTKVVDVYKELLDYGIKTDIYDYEASKDEVFNEFGIKMLHKIDSKYDGILLAVAHKKFKSLDLMKLKRSSKSVVYDLKGFFPKNVVDARL